MGNSEEDVARWITERRAKFPRRHRAALAISDAPPASFAALPAAPSGLVAAYESDDDDDDAGGETGAAGAEGGLCGGSGADAEAVGNVSLREDSVEKREKGEEGHREVERPVEGNTVEEATVPPLTSSARLVLRVDDAMDDAQRRELLQADLEVRRAARKRQRELRGRTLTQRVLQTKPQSLLGALTRHEVAAETSVLLQLLHRAAERNFFEDEN
jgi:hypothetical protein